MADIPALPGFPVTLLGGKGFLRGGMGLGGRSGRRVPGIMARRKYYRLSGPKDSLDKITGFFKKIQYSTSGIWMTGNRFYRKVPVSNTF